MGCVMTIKKFGDVYYGFNNPLASHRPTNPHTQKLRHVIYEWSRGGLAQSGECRLSIQQSGFKLKWEFFVRDKINSHYRYDFDSSNNSFEHATWHRDVDFYFPLRKRECSLNKLAV